MHVVLAIKDQVASDVYALAFEGYFDACKIFPAANLGEAIGFLAGDVTCIVTDTPASLSEASQLLGSPKVAGGEIPYIFLGDLASLPGPLQSYKLLTVVSPEATVREIVEKVDFATRGVSVQAAYSKIPLRTLLFKNMDIRFDLFIRLSDSNFVKVLGPEDVFDQDQFDRFSAKGVDFLYLTKTDFLVFMDRMKSELESLKGQGEKIDIEESMGAMRAIFDTIHGAFQFEGFTPRMRELTEASIGLAITSLRKSPRLKDLLAKIDANKDSYVSWHSMALSFLSCKIASEMGWSSEATFYKLSLAAMLHDLTLARDELAEIQEFAQLKAADLSSKDKERILNHPNESAKLALSFGEVPGEVSFIIEQHHERQDGTGFPRGLDHKDVSPIAALFIVAHDMVNAMYRAGPKQFDLEAYLVECAKRGRFNRGSFGNVFSVVSGGARAGA